MGLFRYCISTLILSLCVVSLPVFADLSANNSSVMVQYENGTMTAEWAVDFTASPMEGYPPLCVKFTVEGPLGDYFWDFGDGSTSNSRNPVHCYQKKGSYWVKMKYFVGQISGEVSKENFIKVKDLMTFVDYKAEPSNGTAPLTAQFSIIGAPTNIYWDFGDGGDSTEFNPRHQYELPGLYSPTLTYCIDGSCDKISKYNYIEVSPGEEVTFNAEKTEGVAPLSTKFIVVGPAETYSWDFGDGTTSYEKDPGHYFTQPGNYTVTLTYSIDGASYTITKSDYIQARSKFTPDFNASPRAGIAPLCVEFDMINRPLSWLWMFGDNITSPDEHGMHCYGIAGSYDAGLHACYNGLCNDIIKQDYITVQQPRIIADTGDDDATIKFRTDAGEGLQYIWDFGDMTSSDSAAPIHRYEEPGDYNVTLSVLGTCGCTTKAVTIVTVKPKKPLDFTATPVSGCAPHCVQFSEQSPSIPKGREWDFGDGEKSEEKNPFHCFQFPGTYSVTLIYEYPDHEENITKPDMITVYAVPQPSFSTNPGSGDAPATITFTDTTIGYESKRFWEFGDGVTGTSARMDHEYTQPGVFNASLSVWGEGDCHNTVYHDIHILKPEVVRYDLNGLPNRGVVPLCTSFKMTGSPYQWSIEYGDGQSTSEQNPFHCFETAGIYSPMLHACDQSGCEDITKPGYIVAIPQNYLNVTLTAGWNLVSVPVSLEPGQDTVNIFADVDTATHSLFTWNSAAGQWTRLTKDSPLDPLSAVWIYSDKSVSVSLPVASKNPEGNLTRTLAKGWNLVSFPGIAASAPDAAFPGDIRWSYILRYDPLTQQFEEPIENGNSGERMIDPREGFWVYMAEPGMLVTPGL